MYTITAIKNKIRAISYRTSRSYPVWILSSILIFLPLTFMFLIFNALHDGLMAAIAYLVKHNFEISFSYRTYVKAKARIEKLARP